MGLTVGIPMTVHVRLCDHCKLYQVRTSAVQCRNLILQLLENALDNSHRIQLVTVNRCRE